MRRILPLCMLLYPIVSLAQLTHDTSFGDNGFAHIDWPSGGIARLYAQLQPDGKVLVSGNHVGTLPREGYVLRLDSNGIIDTSYGTDGYHIIPNLNDDYDGPDIYLLPDNHLIVYCRKNYGATLNKLTPQGTIDPSFVVNAGYNGFLSQDFSIMDPARDHFYFMAPFPQPANRLQRMNTATGLLDTTFGDSAYIVMPVGFNIDSEAAVQADGKITFIRVTYTSDTQAGFVCRFLPDGTPDPDFGVEGSVLLYETTENFNTREECLVYDDSGALYVVSRNWQTFDATTIYKLDANGQLVLSFGTDGKIVLPDNHFLLDVYVHNGSLYGVGRKILNDMFKESELLLAKYSLDGVPDSDFGTNGLYVEDANPYLESGDDLVFTDDGGLIVVGETNEGAFHRAYAAKYLEQALHTDSFTKETLSYNNPVSDVLTVHAKGISQITLFGVDGRQAGFAIGNTVLTSGLSSGLYVGRVLFENGRVVNIKILKR